MSTAPKQIPGSFAALLRTWRYLFAFIALVLFVGLFYFEEDWRGPHAWERYKKLREAQGERFDAKTFVPPIVPSSENFALTPLLAPLFDFIPGTQKWRNTNAMGYASGFAPAYDRAAKAIKAVKNERSNSWIVTRIDLPMWREAFLQSTNRINQPDISVSREETATAVLANLKECEDVLADLREDSQRKYSRFNLRYDNDDPAAILLPHLAVLKHICLVLQLRATSELALGKTDEAFSDINLMLRVADASRDEPILISHLVRIAMVYLALEPIAEGFGQWSEPQLKVLEQRLQQFDFCADMKRALEAERVLFGGGIIEFLRREPEKYEMLQENGVNALPGAIWSAVPNGWFDLEKANYNRLFDEFITPSIDVANRRISPSVCQAAEKKMAAVLNKSRLSLFFRHRAFCSLLLPGSLGVSRKTAFGQTAVDTAAIACAIERYKLAHGALPESLEALVPQFIDKLPHDLIDGRPLRYQRTANGHYAIYSVGWNEKDDGGVAGYKKGEHDLPEEGDWVWR
jgi:hypothetical protein